MNFAGIQKLTLLDYPGKTACTVFTDGCNLRCPYCHNARLVLPETSQKVMFRLTRRVFFFHQSMLNNCVCQKFATSKDFSCSCNLSAIRAMNSEFVGLPIFFDCIVVDFPKVNDTI